MLVILVPLGLAALVAGFWMALSGTSLIPGILLILLGMAIELVAGAIAAARRVRDTAMEWGELLAGGPEALRVVSIQPPKGMFFNRDAVIAFEIEGAEGQRKQVDREIKIPIPQAILWKLIGRVPLPVAALTERRDLNLDVWRRTWWRPGKRRAPQDPSAQR